MQLQYQRQMQMTMQQQLRAQQALMQAQLRAAQAQVQQYQEQVCCTAPLMLHTSIVKESLSCYLVWVVMSGLGQANGVLVAGRLAMADALLKLAQDLVQ